MLVLSMLVVVMVLMLGMIVVFMLEDRLFPEIEQGHAIGFLKFDRDGGGRERANRFFHPWQQRGPDPHNNIRVLQGLSL